MKCFRTYRVSFLSYSAVLLFFMGNSFPFFGKVFNTDITKTIEVISIIIIYMEDF